MDTTYDHLFKILLVGGTGSGKTCFLLRFADNKFTTKFVTTIGIDFRVKTIERRGYRIKLQIWDTAGQERFRSVSASYFRGALGFLCLFDLTKSSSLADMEIWLRMIDDNAKENPQILLVGNKKDLLDNSISVDPADDADGKQTEDSLSSMSSLSTAASTLLTSLVEDQKLSYIETSAKTGENVEKAFEILVDAILDKRIQDLENAESEEKIGAKSSDTSHVEQDKKLIKGAFLGEEEPPRRCFC